MPGLKGTEPLTNKALREQGVPDGLRNMKGHGNESLVKSREGSSEQHRHDELGEKPACWFTDGP